jgi:hypothetical protein
MRRHPDLRRSARRPHDAFAMFTAIRGGLIEGEQIGRGAPGRTLGERLPVLVLDDEAGGIGASRVVAGSSMNQPHARPRALRQ